MANLTLPLDSFERQTGLKYKEC